MEKGWVCMIMKHAHKFLNILYIYMEIYKMLDLTTLRS